MRIVSLLPSATELACGLGLREHLVAVSHACDAPADVAELPRITRSILPDGLSQAEIDARVGAAVRAGRPLYEIDPDLLARLQPDLVVTQGICDVCAVGGAEVRHALDQVPADVRADTSVLSLDGRSVAGVFADLRRLADAVDARVPGTRRRAAARIAELRLTWESLPGAAGVGPEAPRVAMLEWTEPPFSGGHWVPEQVQQAGGRDVLGAPAHDSRRLAWDEILAADPDLVGVVACGYGLDDNLAFARALHDHPDASRLRAVREGRVFAFDANAFFSRPALRLVRGGVLLARVLSGGGDVPGEVVRVPAA